MAGNYIVSARKYRPDSFQTIVGQKAVSSTLKSAILSDKVAHAYLFCGPRGVGKTTAARVLAKTINCKERTSEGEACNVCESCKAFEEQRSYNIFELDAASNNSVEDIRNLTEQVAMPPVFGTHKVYIIDEVHMLSQAAFNAFLKTLEEPPAYAIFILATTEKHKILPTILSRCQIFDFKRIGLMDITQHLAYVAKSEGVPAEEEALAMIAEKADGGMRDALSMFDRIASYSEDGVSYQSALSCLNLLDYNAYVKFIEALLESEYRELLLLLNELFARGFDGLIILQGFASFTRDLLMAQFPNTLKLLEKPERVQTLYQSVAQRCPTEVLHKMLQELIQAEQSYRTSANKRLLVELTFLNLVPIFEENGFAKGLVKPNENAQVQPIQGTAVVSASSVAPQTASTAPQQTPQTTPQQSAPQPQAKAGEKAKEEPASAKEEAESPKGDGQNTQVKPQAKKELSLEARRKALLLAGKFEELDKLDALEAQKKVEKKEERATREEHNDFSEEELHRYWLAFAQEELKPTEAMIGAIMRRDYPKLKEGYKIEYSITDSDIVRDDFTQVMTRLMPYLKSRLHNTDITLELLAKTGDAQRRRPANMAERERAMIELNPNLEKLKERLKLFL